MSVALFDYRCPEHGSWTRLSHDGEPYQDGCPKCQYKATRVVVTPVTVEERFLVFHAENPHVYDTLRWLALRWVRRNPGKPCSIAMLFETARYLDGMRTSGEPWRLNNDYRSRYARLLMEREPDLAGKFETRRLTA